MSNLWIVGLVILVIATYNGIRVQAFREGRGADVRRYQELLGSPLLILIGGVLLIAGIVILIF